MQEQKYHDEVLLASCSDQGFLFSFSEQVAAINVAVDCSGYG